MNNETEIYCYCIPPVDFFEYAMTEKQLIKKLRETAIRGPWAYDENDFSLKVHLSKQDIQNDLSSLEKLKTGAKKGFEKLHWEGDLCDRPYYFSIPCPPSFDIALIIKQDNNGTCFVASPVPLPHLESSPDDFCVETVKDSEVSYMD
jgi:hypothetical protein